MPYASGETPQVGDIVFCQKADWGLKMQEYTVKQVALYDGELLVDDKDAIGTFRPNRFTLVKRAKEETKMVEPDPLKIHIGCYHKKIYGFVNTDIREDVHPDVVCDGLTLEPFRNNSADLIYSSHCLEHWDRANGRKALQRWYEVLKPGGILRVAVPDFEKLAAHYLFYKDMKWISHSLNGSQKHPFDYHLAMYDEALLTEILKEIGFKDVKRYDHNKTEHFYVDDYSASYSYERHIPDRGVPKPVLISLNLEATK